MLTPANKEDNMISTPEVRESEDISSARRRRLFCEQYVLNRALTVSDNIDTSVVTESLKMWAGLEIMGGNDDD